MRKGIINIPSLGVKVLMYTNTHTQNKHHYMLPSLVSTSGCDGTSPFVTGSEESLDSMTGIFSSRADLRFKINKQSHNVQSGP